MRIGSHHTAMDSWLGLAIVGLTVLTGPAEGLGPRITFARGDSSRPLAQFSKEGYHNYSTLRLSADGKRLYVGARDVLFSFHLATLGTMELTKELHWKATEKKVQECSFKGKSKERDCFNFIRVVLPVNETHIYTCGTYAFSPTCAYIDVETFSLLSNSSGAPLTEDGKGRCPFDPQRKYTATMVDGELYMGTHSDFQGIQSIISRNLGHTVALKTEPSFSWLQDPTFVGSTFVRESEGDKVYFFFTEARSKSDLLQKMSVSLVARVCKDDVGGERVLQKRWTTFLKAQILCYLPEDQFPFNILQDVFVSEGEDKEEPVFYGVFSSQWFRGGSDSSAVCAFALRDVQKVFEGQYKVLNRETQSWSTYTGEVPEPRPGACNTGPSLDATLNLVKDIFLMDGVVHPIGRRPQLVRAMEKYVKIAVDNVRSLNAMRHRVMFLITDGGFLHKALYVNNTSYIIEEIQLFPTPQLVQGLVLSAEKGTLYVGSSSGVLQVPLSNCSVYPSCGECVLSRDPYCAWDPSDTACKETRRQPNTHDWIQDVENADAALVCLPPTEKARPRMFRPKERPKGSAPPLEMVVPRNSLVSLPCEARSKLARKSWTHDGREVSVSELGSSRGSLEFAAAASRQGLWECWATENRFLTLVVSYSLAIGGDYVDAPVAERDSSVWLAANRGQGSRAEAVKTYWSELVLVSVLFAASAALVAVAAAFRYGGRLRSKGRVREAGPPRPGNANPAAETAPLNKGAAGNGSCRNLPDGEERGARPASARREDPAESRSGGPSAGSDPLQGPPRPNAQTQVDI